VGFVKKYEICEEINLFIFVDKQFA